ncbi:MAG: DUF2842 domain-containing protein, partial [Sphingopyxis sp.]
KGMDCDVMTPPQPQPSWRKPAGIFIILTLIGFWAWLVTTLMDMLGPLSTAANIAIYAIAGTAWIAPLGPLLSWMETGRWHHP